ncbi:MAG: right-handed parallel beta-helix repeat-containing protein [Candidatus Heimdallarchaeota archaeon]|nr:right-handed parallel beta-helix repeat-containing protein [Candidatus Heimdallarchaeota archaeon]MBY8993714.1 right-handed parallel beta-helix repeat-containing protein [Candidatus Heimdallarchaeota archaeon]
MRIKGIIIIFIICIGSSITSIMKNENLKDNDSKISLIQNQNDFILNSEIFIEINDDQDFIDLAFDGSGTEENPYLIKDLIITSNYDIAISIANTTKYFKIQNCTITTANLGIRIVDISPSTAIIYNNKLSDNSEYSIWLTNALGSEIINNTCTLCNRYGIWIEHCDDSIINGNNVTNGGYRFSGHGVWAFISYVVEDNFVNGKPLGYFKQQDNITIDDDTYGQLHFIACNNLTVRNQILEDTTMGIVVYHSPLAQLYNNTCNNNGWGINIATESPYSIIENNTCSNNYYFGIGMNYVSSNTTIRNNTIEGNLDRGIGLTRISHTDVYNNTIKNNLVGIKLSISSYNSIFSNNIESNTEYGIYLRTDSNLNEIYHNILINNNLLGQSQAYDECFSNKWYEETLNQGNYWSDWTGTGIYEIDGITNAFDPCPTFPYSDFPECSYSPTTPTASSPPPTLKLLGFTIGMFSISIIILFISFVKMKRK